jgi:hypothetical protein
MDKEIWSTFKKPIDVAMENFLLAIRLIAVAIAFGLLAGILLG